MVLAEANDLCVVPKATAHGELSDSFHGQSKQM